MVHGDHRLLLAQDEQVFAYVRTLGSTRLLVLANLSGATANVDLGADADLLAGRILIATHAHQVPAGPVVSLRPWESLAVLSTIGA